jgi:crotonobetainyl-CoA:carnitine CoA-transferase CaiB-like acyl-CoA transferase
MHADPQAILRGMVPTLEHPTEGLVQTIGLPVKFTQTPGGVQGPAPTLGQHTDEVLAEYGLTLPEAS